MRKALPAFMLSTLLMLTSCTANAPTGNSIEGIINTINAQIEGTGCFPASSYINCYRFDDLNVYSWGDVGGANTFVVEDAGGAFYVYSCPYSGIDGVNRGSNEDEIIIFIDGEIFNFDEIFRNFPGRLTINYKEGTVVAAEFWMASGMYGLQCGDDPMQFIDCSVKDNRVVFRFTWDGDRSSLTPGTEVHIKQNVHRENEPASITFVFQDTRDTLPASFYGEIESLEGVLAVEHNYLDEAILAGTQITITYEPSYQLFSGFNNSGGLLEFEDFYFTIERT